MCHVALDRPGVFDTATVYGLICPARFSAPIPTGPGAHPASCTIGTVSLSREVMQPEPGFDHPSLSSAVVKERVECTSTPLLGLNEFTFTFAPRGLILLAQHMYTRMYLLFLVCPQNKQRLLS
jgi:hypothetical protein